MTHPLDTLVKETAPIGDDAVRTLALDGERELLEAILAEPAEAPASVPVPARTSRRGPRVAWRRPRVAVGAVGAALAIALALAGVTLTGGGGVQAGPERAWAAQALRVAGAVPRLLLDAPGWHVERADEFSVDTGELTFANGSTTLELRWLPARLHDRLLASTGGDMRRVGDIEVAGRTAALFGPGESVRGHTAIWRAGDHVLELRNTSTGAPAGIRRDASGAIVPPWQGLMSSTRFAQLVASLQPASVDGWLAAMPASVVLPDARAATVRTMLEGVALPPGFRPPAPDAQGAVRDRYQLGAQVTSAVVCAWIGRWVEARRAGDERAAQEAVSAMAGSRDWPVMRAMDAEGDYPEVVSRYADAMAGRASVPAGRDGLTVEGTYREALGCR